MGIDRTHSYLGAILDAIESEIEAPGPMPDEMWATVNGDRDATEQAIRIAIRLTKQCIRDRILLLPTGPLVPVEAIRDARNALWKEHGPLAYVGDCPKCANLKALDEWLSRLGATPRGNE